MTVNATMLWLLGCSWPLIIVVIDDNHYTIDSIIFVGNYQKSLDFNGSGKINSSLPHKLIAHCWAVSLTLDALDFDSGWQYLLIDFISWLFLNSSLRRMKLIRGMLDKFREKSTYVGSKCSDFDFKALKLHFFFFFLTFYRNLRS